MCSLLKMGKYQFLSFVKEWMSLKEVCTLDNAFCAKSSRVLFLELLSDHVAHNVGLIGPSDLILSDIFYSWLHLRNITLGRVQTVGSRIEKYLVMKSQITSSFSSISVKKCSNKNVKSLLGYLSLCPKLNELIVEGLADNNTCFESFFDCPNNLTHVELRNIILSANFLISLGNCKCITNLSLMGCESMSDTEFCGLISKNTRLTILSISGCVKLTDTSLTCVASNCKLLVDLNASDTTGYSFENLNLEGLLTSCDQITSLDISSNYESVTYSTATLIAQHCKGLLKLNISLNGKITHAGMEIVCSNCVNLTCLDMAGLCLSQQIMDVISAHLNKLRSIRIERSEMFSAHLSYVVLFSMFSEITTFHYDFGLIVGTPHESVKIRDDYSSHDRSQLLRAILPKLRKIEEIELMHMYSHDDLGQLFLQCFTQLRVFKVGNLDHFTDILVLQLAEGTSMLVEVDFCFNRSLTDGSLCKLFENNHNLAQVNLNYLTLITDVSIVALAKCCRYLEVLNVRLCTRLTDISIDALCTYSRCLSKIDTRRTKFSAEAMERLEKCCVGLSKE